MTEIARYVSEDEISEDVKVLMKAAHELSKRTFLTVWNSLDTFLHSEEITVEKAQSFFSTFIVSFTSYFIKNIKKVSDESESCYTLLDIQESIFKGVSETLGTKVSELKEKSALGEIKKL